MKNINNTVLKVKNLNIKSGNKIELVNNINFELKHGKTLGIVGESGSGKTLICKAILNLLSFNNLIATGCINYNNQNILQLNEKQMQNIRGSKIALIMQNPHTAFDPAYRIKNQITETLCQHKQLSKAEIIVQFSEELKQLNLADTERILNSYPHMLSGGMLQRIMIVLTFMLNPQIIIADEATTALDTENQFIIIEELKKRKASNNSLIIISHDIGVITQLADEILVMYKGQIVEQGSLEHIILSPKNPYTKKLLNAKLLHSEE
ncbi:ABC transporter ATP-binding protein [Clostridium sp. 'deep sea']|uniref:ABC transporter ATP-binding protein n=1 Tax=Clostridium sp. 'deep sea' TaxID=2779445 RepID=UPI0018969A3C|nr:ABC transporter ATP-binding protein [Clostridium sp. 'deep sea']QOR34986.1 ABC transporter ATP-binding protein [Clostridium sp. 'deep sea']